MRERFLALFPARRYAIPAVVSGALMALCFAKTSLWFLSVVAFVPICVVWLRDPPGPREGFKVGWLLGVSYFAVLMRWLLALIPTADVKIPGIMLPSLLALSMYLALYPGVAGWLTGLVARAGRGWVLASFPAAWVIGEVLRARGDLAFPWGLLGYTLTDKPELLQLASVTGIYGLAIFILLVNLGIAAIAAWRGTRGRIVLAAAVVLLVGVYVWGANEVERWRVPGDNTVRVAVVQPNVDLAVKWKAEFKDSTLTLLEKLVREGAAAGAEVIVFPETAAPVYIEGQDRRFRASLQSWSQQLNVPIYIGFLDHRYDGPKDQLNIYNSSGVFMPDGSVQKYDKYHLLPFGEVIPFAKYWRFLRRIEFGQANFSHGPGVTPLEAGRAVMSPLICFESVFPYLCRRGLDQGANVLVNITNDGWFADSPGPFQHADMSIVRAVEFRRYLLRAANTGVSMVVNPAGEVIAEKGLYTEDVIVEDVELLTGRSVYSRLGDLPVLVICMVVLATGIIVSRRASAND